MEMTLFRSRLACRTWKKTSALPRQYQQCFEVPGKSKGQISEYSSDGYRRWETSERPCVSVDANPTLPGKH